MIRAADIESVYPVPGGLALVVREPDPNSVVNVRRARTLEFDFDACTELTRRIAYEMVKRASESVGGSNPDEILSKAREALGG